MELDDALAQVESVGTKEFPAYVMSDLEGGKLFAEASMGFLGDVKYKLDMGRFLTVETKIKDPVLATLGMQLAGWIVDGTMLSGPLRLKVKKPSFIFKQFDFKYEGNLPRIICVEGTATPEQLAKALGAQGIKSARLLYIDPNSHAQLVNVLARACEVALFQIGHKKDLNRFEITQAESKVKIEIPEEGDMSLYLNEMIRLNAQVTLEGDFGGERKFANAVTRTSKYSGKTFSDIVSKAGGIDKISPEAFTVGELKIVDAGKTYAFK